MPDRSAPLIANVEVPADEFLAGWDAAASRLFVSAVALLDARAGTSAAVRISIRRTGIAATVRGTVMAVRRAGSRALPAGVSLALGGEGAAAARYLALVAQGRPVDFNDREPRYVVERPVVIAPAEARAFASTTVNVSESGCCVRWSGPAPLVGETVRIRSGRLLFAPVAGATVCWTRSAAGSGGTAAGLRLAPAGRAARAWRSLVAHAARSGAPVL
jgi:PilZ domain-containing protein